MTALDFSHCQGRPLVMGILNTTPDSFSDGGRFDRPEQALRHAVEMAGEGADLIDIGGESTRPGAAAVSAGEEIDRVVPVIETVRAETGLPVSIDTSKAEVMQAAVRAGAGLINDVYALRRPGALEMAAQLQVPVCLMHMQGEPRTMQHEPRYENVEAEVAQFLGERAEACERAGIARDAILIDPGFGFGKALDHNVALFRGLAALCRGRYPVLVGVSRKSMLGQITGREVGGRLAASVAAAVLACRAGASVLRVHDVAPTVDALRICRELGA